jgi:hypothetical protein
MHFTPYTKRFLICVIVVCCFNHNCLAQTDSLRLRKNALYFEVGGSAIYSVNYDRVQHFKNKPLALSFRVGYSYFELFNSVIIETPLSSSLLVGRKPGKIETGVSATYNSGRNYSQVNSFQYGLIIGVRHQNNYKKGVLLRLNYTPQLLKNHNEGWEVKHFAGFSIGYSF